MRITRTILAFLLIFAAGAAILGAAESAQAKATRLKVTAEQANLREKPDIGSSIMQAIPEGTILEADKKEGEWYYVRYTLEDGGVVGGWIHESLVTVVEKGAVSETPAEKPVARPPARERPRPRLPRIGGIQPPEFRTGSIPLEFSVSAGVATLAPRDLNDATRGDVDWFAAAAGLIATQEAGVLHVAGLIGFELSYRFSPRLSFGVGADYLRGSNADLIELVSTASAGTVTTKPSVRAVPFKATVRFYPGAGLYLRGALGIYSAKAGYLFRNEDAQGWVQDKGSASATGLGAEAAFGGEWDIAPRTVVFAEAGMRMASFSGLTGQNAHRDSTGQSSIEGGTLFFFKRTAGAETAYPAILVTAAAPAGEGIVDARRARINISGTSLRVGVRYRF
jgi:hypothetical protein